MIYCTCSTQGPACRFDHGQYSERIDNRAREIWNDLDRVCSLLLDLRELVYTNPYPLRQSDGTVKMVGDTVRTGTVALSALRDGDYSEFGRIVHAALSKEIDAKAQEEIDDEDLEADRGRYAA